MRKMWYTGMHEPERVYTIQNVHAHWICVYMCTLVHARSCPSVLNTSEYARARSLPACIPISSVHTRVRSYPLWSLSLTLYDPCDLCAPTDMDHSSLPFTVLSSTYYDCLLTPLLQHSHSLYILSESSFFHMTDPSPVVSAHVAPLINHRWHTPLSLLCFNTNTEDGEATSCSEHNS